MDGTHNEKTIICIIINIFIFGLIAFSGIQTHRLAVFRQQLDNYRTELEAAHDRQSELREIISKTGTVLCETANTVSDIRRQITEIRKNYEDMEKLLSNNDWDSMRNDSFTNYKEIE